MKKLNIAASTSAMPCFESQREVVDVLHTDFTDVAAVVLSVQDINNGVIESIHSLGLDIPIFAAVCCEEELNTDVLPSLNGVFELCGDNTDFYGKQLESVAEKYEKELLPPFFSTLKNMLKWGILLLPVRDTKVVSSSVNIRLDVNSLTSTVKLFSVLICVMLTSN